MARCHTTVHLPRTGQERRRTACTHARRPSLLCLIDSTGRTVLGRHMRYLRCHGIAVLLLAGMALGAPAAATAGQKPASGTYRGSAEQRGTGSRGQSVDRNYPVRMRFSAFGSSVAYPSLGCGGTLRPAGFSGGRRVYREVITYGGCDGGGTWKVLVSSSRRLQATWTRSGTDYIVSAILTR